MEGVIGFGFLLTFTWALYFVVANLKTRYSKPRRLTSECPRCLNYNPRNLKGGKFSCTVCGFQME